MGDYKPSPSLPTEIILTILSDLDWLMLHRCLSVSKLFSEIAKSIIEKRIKLALETINTIIASEKEDAKKRQMLKDTAKADEVMAWVLFDHVAACELLLHPSASLIIGNIQEIADSHQEKIKRMIYQKAIPQLLSEAGRKWDRDLVIEGGGILLSIAELLPMELGLGINLPQVNTLFSEMFFKSTGSNATKDYLYQILLLLKERGVILDLTPHLKSNLGEQEGPSSPTARRRP